MSHEAKRGWATFCELHGVTFSAMVEASGRLLGGLGDEGAALKNETVIDLARRIDHERAKRR